SGSWRRSSSRALRGGSSSAWGRRIDAAVGREPACPGCAEISIAKRKLMALGSFRQRSNAVSYRESTILVDCNEPASSRSRTKIAVIVATPLARSPSGKDGSALFNEGPSRFPVVIGTTGLDLPLGFKIEKLSQCTAFRSIEILLHQCEGDAWAPRQFPCK